MVRTSYLTDGQRFPLVVELTHAQLEPVEWVRSNLAFIDEALRSHAAILFRNFALPTPVAFEAFAAAISPQLFGEYGDVAKKEAGRADVRVHAVSQEQDDPVSQRELASRTLANPPVVLLRAAFAHRRSHANRGLPGSAEASAGASGRRLRAQGAAVRQNFHAATRRRLAAVLQDGQSRGG